MAFGMKNAGPVPHYDARERNFSRPPLEEKAWNKAKERKVKDLVVNVCFFTVIGIGILLCNYSNKSEKDEIIGWKNGGEAVTYDVTLSYPSTRFNILDTLANKVKSGAIDSFDIKITRTETGLRKKITVEDDNITKDDTLFEKNLILYENSRY